MKLIPTVNTQYHITTVTQLAGGCRCECVKCGFSQDGKKHPSSIKLCRLNKGQRVFYMIICPFKKLQHLISTAPSELLQFALVGGGSLNFAPALVWTNKLLCDISKHSVIRFIVIFGLV